VWSCLFPIGEPRSRRSFPSTSPIQYYLNASPSAMRPYHCLLYDNGASSVIIHSSSCYLLQFPNIKVSPEPILNDNTPGTWHFSLISFDHHPSSKGALILVLRIWMLWGSINTRVLKSADASAHDLLSCLATHVLCSLQASTYSVQRSTLDIAILTRYLLHARVRAIGSVLYRCCRILVKDT
jgi:hypothetical protein